MKREDIKVGMMLKRNPTCGSWGKHASGTVARVEQVKPLRFYNGGDYDYAPEMYELYGPPAAPVQEAECAPPPPPRTATQHPGLGAKYDAGKPIWTLLFSAQGMLASLRGVVDVLMFGAKKYAAFSWRTVPDAETRYLNALTRHYVAIMEGGLTARDEESGELHIDHLNCNGLFLGELARKDKK